MQNGGNRWACGHVEVDHVSVRVCIPRRPTKVMQFPVMRFSVSPPPLDLGALNTSGVCFSHILSNSIICPTLGKSPLDRINFLTAPPPDVGSLLLWI